MNKYTEALALLREWGDTPKIVSQEAVEFAIIADEALQIADRLEQMWEEVKDKEFPPSMFQNCRDCGDYMQGKKDALADIRGDTE